MHILTNYDGNGLRGNWATQALHTIEKLGLILLLVILLTVVMRQLIMILNGLVRKSYVKNPANDNLSVNHGPNLLTVGSSTRHKPTPF